MAYFNGNFAWLKWRDTYGHNGYNLKGITNIAYCPVEVMELLRNFDVYWPCCMWLVSNYCVALNKVNLKQRRWPWTSRWHGMWIDQVNKGSLFWTVQSSASIPNKVTGPWLQVQYSQLSPCPEIFATWPVSPLLHPQTQCLIEIIGPPAILMPILASPGKHSQI